jgi:alanyl-tRNA synthetase
MLKLVLFKSGATTDGKTVVRGVFRLYETEGLPLDVLFEALKERRCIPDWEHFVQEAEAAGMKRDRVLLKIDPAISDTYGPETRDLILSRLRSG